MIRLKYFYICDLCEKEIAGDQFDCSNFLTIDFPRPASTYTYQIGYTVEMCNECAGPLAEKRDEIIRKWREK